MGRNCTESSENEVKVIHEARHIYASYVGDIVKGRMEGYGTYECESGAVYEGAFKDGQFHGKGSLTYASGAIFNGIWNEGKVTAGFYQFSDRFSFAPTDDKLTGWKYLNPVWSRQICMREIDGMMPIGRNTCSADCCEKTGIPTHKIPRDCFDAGDGFYDPATRVVYRYLDTSLSDGEVNNQENWQFLRYVDMQEGKWIKRKCRKGNDEVVGPKYCQLVEERETTNRIGDVAMEKQGTFSKYSISFKELATAEMPHHEASHLHQ